MTRLSLYAIFPTIFLLAGPVHAQGTEEKTIAVIAPKVPGGPNLAGPVNRFVVGGLKAELKVLPPKVVQKAAVKAKVRGKALATPPGAQKVGERAGATHVVLIEGVREVSPTGKKGKPVFSAAVSIIDVASGDVTFTATYALQGKALTKKIADMLVSEVLASLNAAAPAAAEPPAEPPAEPVAAVEPPPPPPDVPPPPAGDAATGDSTAAPGGETPAEGVPAEGAPQDGGSMAATPPAQEPSPVPEETVAAVSVSEEAEPTRGNGARPGLEVQVGGIVLPRQANVSSTAGVPEPLTYDGPLPGAHLQLHLYPFSFGGEGSWYEGIGVHLDGDFMQVKTTLESTNESATSTITALGGGLSYRLVFWGSRTAPDLTIEGGYRYFAFPLPVSFGFPGVRYRGAYVGGTLTIPLGTEAFALVAGGSYMPAVEATRRVAGLGTHDGTTAFRGEGGLRLRFGSFTLLALGRIEAYASTFTGTATDANLGANFDIENAEVSDSMLGGTVAVGMAF